LAVKAVLGRADQVDTLVFDEVDAGVGGKAALAVGGVLNRLAQTHQVIVVTHLAQIAVLADAHFVVERAGKSDPETRLREVTGEERIREIARMLSGTVDDASMAHAAEMLRETIRR
jgi:DNA repair protein RecN (Recombination protein N)